jgi:hypothetical protein
MAQKHKDKEPESFDQFKMGVISNSNDIYPFKTPIIENEMVKCICGQVSTKNIVRYDL